MGMSIGTAFAEPHTEAETPAMTLAQFLSCRVSDGLCFGCGCPTDLIPDSRGLIWLRCPSCGVEIASEEFGSSEKSELVLRAA